MSSVVIAGNTSGSVTLSAPDVAGTTTLNLPATSGTVVTANGSNIISVSGVQFPATQSASADANCLDDYEEGTWTPTLTIGGNSGATQATRYGLYTKIGNVVTVTWRLSISNKNGLTGQIGVSGLPFTATFEGWTCAGINAFNWIGGTKYPVVQIAGGGTAMAIKALGTDADFNHGEISDGFEIRAVFSYRTA